MSQEQTQEFGKLRSFFWPVHRHELKKILPMLLIFFCISFNYTILRDTKDTIVVGASGAGTIPFLKFWGVVPAAIIFMLVYSKLSNILSKENLFYVTILPFIVFFAAFAFILYPNHEALHPTKTADLIQAYLPEGLSGLVACFRDWTFSLFYICSELWGSAVLSLLFWGFANDIMRVKEAKRFYALLGIGANIALVFSGPTVMWFSYIGKSMPQDVKWQFTLNWLMGLVFVSGIVIIATYRWMQKNVLTDPQLFNPEEIVKKKSKPKMGMLESLTFLLKSKYLLNIAVLVMAYGIAINLVEVTWKNQLKMQFPDNNDYNLFMGFFSTVTGLVTINVLFLGGYIIRNKGWGFAASLTPIMLMVTGIAFFAFVLYKDTLTPFASQLGVTTTLMAVVFGMMQNFLSKSTKYALFDPTKEMAYIPLDQESKVKGKAAIDVVGARLGKSGGSLIQQGLIIWAGHVSRIAPYAAVTMVGIIALWLVAVKSLNKKFLDITSTKPTDSKEPKPATATT